MRLFQEISRFSEFRRHIIGVPQRMPARRLREIEASGRMLRVVHNTMPPLVEYSLTEEGRSLEALILSDARLLEGVDRAGTWPSERHQRIS